MRCGIMELQFFSVEKYLTNVFKATFLPPLSWQAPLFLSLVMYLLLMHQFPPSPKHEKLHWKINQLLLLLSLPQSRIAKQS